MKGSTKATKVQQLSQVDQDELKRKEEAKLRREEESRVKKEEYKQLSERGARQKEQAEEGKFKKSSDLI